MNILARVRGFLGWSAAAEQDGDPDRAGRISRAALALAEAASQTAGTTDERWYAVASHALAVAVLQGPEAGLQLARSEGLTSEPGSRDISVAYAAAQRAAAGIASTMGGSTVCCGHLRNALRIEVAGLTGRLPPSADPRQVRRLVLETGDDHGAAVLAKGAAKLAVAHGLGGEQRQALGWLRATVARASRANWTAGQEAWPDMANAALVVRRISADAERQVQTLIDEVGAHLPAEPPPGFERPPSWDALRPPAVSQVVV